jgi:hypothetical protein
MRAGFDIARQMTSGLEGRESAWCFIRDFAESWLTPLVDGDGCSEVDLDTAEHRLGFRLPAALREAYGLFGRRGDLTSNQDTLLGPDELYLDSAEDVLIFRVENEAAARWGLLRADLDEPDPRVVIRLNLRDEQSESWEAWLHTFSSTCMEIVLSESLYASEELSDNRGLEDGDTELLKHGYVALSLPHYPTSPMDMPAVRWFVGPDVMVRDDQQGWLWARARTTAALDDVRRDLPGYWLMAEGC